ncbi:hypothetical protein E6P09_09730 [Haloferax mediterranei ATCC 33500]|uniref:Uncharacterized protein n=1 Tax=Haloferax mediterranei (strain ATCC 33500 / DSM 1411 / JCM 8866 / NBRC 14739 / NCIMB 2177 / R-4) TaxID=523841 RepID=M0J4L4_HALMT|nr:hypothetical protein BM92_02480 [Haloferax mediterranei ATCC 33500]EMA04052.1 hypothetical protein C439_03803 [Haloferax mediterranei ATCC 33500]QCQ75526.1 hypothetical protein E6P09_09730 [Haloferax mediterranei ATCC 33500]
MDKTEIFQALTLWFVVLIFLQTTPSQSGVVHTVIGVVALALMWVIPIYLFVRAFNGVAAR